MTGQGHGPSGPTATPRGGVYPRGTVEFERLAFFTDAIYAISLTLLVVGLAVPKLADPTVSSDLWSALRDVQSGILMFFISFFVIGSFWLAHHRFFSGLASVDRSLLSASLGYLALIAFLPFPSALLGQYSQNSVAVALYALCIALVASAEVVLQHIARTHDLLLRAPPPVAVRWGLVASLAPAGLFLVSIPIAFISPTLGILSWLLGIPLGMTIGRRMPAEAAQYFAQ